MNRTLISLLVLVLLNVAPAFAKTEPKPKQGFEWKEFGLLAVQHRGRMKPFDTFAQETAQFITGRVKWNGYVPTDLVLTWLTSYDNGWNEIPFVKVEYGPLKKALGLDSGRSYFSPKELKEAPALTTLMQGAAEKQRRKERNTELEKKAMQVQNQLSSLEGIVSGEDIFILPSPDGIEKPWLSLASLTGPHRGRLPYATEKSEQLGTLLRAVLQAHLSEDAAKWNQSVGPLNEFIRNELGKGGYPSRKDLERELFYNHMRPFRAAWIFYTIAFVILASYLVTKKAAFKWLGLGSLLVGFGYHILGFVLRMLISGRPPVTNMYESIIWVTWGCILFSLIIWMVYKNALIPCAATVFAVVGLVLADNLPFVLDTHIHPLEPVLRSNFWLTIHVLTITLSYAAFALSLCLGNVVLGAYLFKTEKTAAIQNLTLYMYRAIQIGVILLAAGTILGGVWADYSWGRFWGWDPKEVWALIALLLYIAVLHGRFTGWLKGFGFVATNVLAFLGVVMAWYGVNFVLGVGLHSYGFGSGGGIYVMSYLTLQLAFIGAAYLKYRGAKAAGKTSAAIFPK